MRNPILLLRRAGVLALSAAGFMAAPPVEAQQRPRTRAEAPSRPAPARAPASTRPAETAPRVQNLPANVRSRALARGGYAVVVDLDANRLYFARGRRVLWSAPVGTGTGLRLEHDRGEWDFATPNGTFHVTHKGVEPDWIAPDWYFIENGLRVPPANSDARRFPRGLGSAAVFIGQGLAIHGTDKPELLGQRVSHGCIRLSNADALRLFHNVQVGTEIVMVGGRNPQPAATPRQTAAASTRRTGANGERLPPPRDPFIVELEDEETEDLLERLDDELFAAVAARGAQTRWHQVASVLLFRGARQNDDEALGGLLERLTDLGTGALRDEYATFVTDAYAQGTLRTLAVMSTLDRATRELVARAIVDGSLALFPGDVNAAGAPWPTRKAPREVLRRASQRSWDALAAAEQAFRERNGLAVR
jgi:lipoprotein-anchoring transpeptidase ErfK/SrfK